MAGAGTAYRVLVTTERAGSGPGAAALVTVRLEAAGLSLEEAAVECEVGGPGLGAALVARPDPASLLYSVWRDEDCGKAGELPLRVVVRPRYHPAARGRHTLHRGLARLVGRPHLQHPKVALTAVHAYARVAQLYNKERKTIECDGVLRAIFHCEELELRQLWQHLRPLVTRLEEPAVRLTHQLSELSKQSQAEITVKLDTARNIFPADWRFTSDTKRSMPRTQSLLPLQKPPKKLNFKRIRSIEL